MSTPARINAGNPAGGQFTATARAEAEVDLGPGQPHLVDTINEVQRTAALDAEQLDDWAVEGFDARSAKSSRLVASTSLTAPPVGAINAAAQYAATQNEGSAR